MIIDRRGGAAQKRVAREEMLFTVDRQRSLFDQTGPDAVGALAFLTPEGARPQAPVTKRLVIGSGAAPFDRHAVTIGEQDTTTDAAYRQKKSVEARLRSPDQRPILPAPDRVRFR